MIINGIDVGQIEHSKSAAAEDPATADRRPELVARWVGGTRSRIECGPVVTHLGGEGELNPMRMLLATLAACDVDVIATQAALLGLGIGDLSIEAKGHFNARAYFGLEGCPGSGYDQISYIVRLHAPRATAKQIDELRRRLERCSPVGDSLTRSIPLNLHFEVEPPVTSA